jgi:predicted PurR-regulated permease PerM
MSVPRAARVNDPLHDMVGQVAPPLGTETVSSTSGRAPDDARETAATTREYYQEVEITPETVERVGAALFVLWLKIGATLLIAWLLVLVWPVVVLFILCLMLVATFNPLVRRLQTRLTRGWAITAVVSVLVSFGAGVLILMIPPLVRQGRNLAVNLPHYLLAIENSARQMGIPLRLQGSGLDLSRRVASMGPEVLNVLGTVVGGVTGVLTVVVLTTYLLIDGPRVATSLFRLLPRSERLPIRQMFAEIGLQVGSYMRGQFITSAAAGLFSFIVLTALNVPEPLALAFLMAVSDIIPMVGPLIGTVPAVLIALTRGTPVALIVLAAFVLYHQIESHVLVPRIYGRTMSLSPSIVVIAILIGATLMGILGALLALPVAAAVPVVLRYIQEWQDREEAGQTPKGPALP